MHYFTSVPLSEAVQVAAKIYQNQVPVWVLIAEKEGHVFHQKSVKEYHALCMVMFLERFLLKNSANL